MGIFAYFATKHRLDESAVKKIYNVHSDEEYETGGYLYVYNPYGDVRISVDLLFQGTINEVDGELYYYIISDGHTSADLFATRGDIDGKEPPRDKIKSLTDCLLGESSYFKVAFYDDYFYSPDADEYLGFLNSLFLDSTKWEITLSPEQFFDIMINCFNYPFSSSIEAIYYISAHI